MYKHVLGYLLAGSLGVAAGSQLNTQAAAVPIGESLVHSAQADVLEQASIEAAVLPLAMGVMQKRIDVELIEAPCQVSDMSFHWFENQGKCALRWEFSMAPLRKEWVKE